MADILILTSQDEIFDALKRKLDEGYTKEELSVISKTNCISAALKVQT